MLLGSWKVKGNSNLPAPISPETSFKRTFEEYVINDIVIFFCFHIESTIERQLFDIVWYCFNEQVLNLFGSKRICDNCCLNETQ